MTNLLIESNLWCNTNRNDKVYNIYLYKKPLCDSWCVEVSYGRRGSYLTKHVKKENVIYPVAEKVYMKLMNDKLAKGYNRVQSNLDGIVFESIKKTFFSTYVLELYASQLLNEEEYLRVKGMLNSDEESMNLAIGVITNKDLKHGGRAN